MSQRQNDYSQLVELFEDWRDFEHPPVLHGAPDYTVERFEVAYPKWQLLRDRLQAIDPSEWPIGQQVDWHILRAELNGFDFNYRVLKPWERDPAFYQSIWLKKSDVPAHEGPTHHAVLELWTYQFPLTPAEEERLLGDLRVIPPLMKQARQNLTGNARDLWITGIQEIESQKTYLSVIEEKLGQNVPEKIKAAIEAAKSSTDGLVSWLKDEAPKKTGPSGIGKEEYSWYLKYVHLVPLTWEDEVRLLKRELDRAWSSLKLEEHHNRSLPQLIPVSTPEEYTRLADRSATKLMQFLEEKEILTVKEYMEPALREQLGSFVPEDSRNFFSIGSHHDPTPLFCHFYHWFELAQMREEPHESPIRRGALLYNIFDSRSEGVATGVEEIFMHAGLHQDNPRAREIVWIMLAQRAARGLGSLYAHANLMTMEEAGGVHTEWTPRGWMKTEKELLMFEQHLYLRQPGYGTSYVTGKYLLERTMADYARILEERGEEFTLLRFFDELNSIGSIPMSLVRWQMTGLDNEIRNLMDEVP
ncbi:MAG: hypothetical protein JSU96_13940 [Acidobacteriota bacterium]|nr:MAG: hypothetical protein JSU96_13940 [Acidobacteriota bacterium]